MLPLLQYVPLPTTVDPLFFKQLADLKLKGGLEEKEVDFEGVFNNAPGAAPATGLQSNRLTIRDLDAGVAQELPTRGGGGEGRRASTVLVRGKAFNVNTIERFKECDRGAFLRECVQSLWQSIKNGEADANPAVLVQARLLVFADLKKWHFHHWCALPVIQPPTNTGVRGGRIGSVRHALGDTMARQVADRYAGDGESHALQHVFWVECSESDNPDEQKVIGVQALPQMCCRKMCRMQIKLRAVEAVEANVEALIKKHQNDPSSELTLFERVLQNAVPTLAFVDPSHVEGVAGWPLRNILAYIYYHFVSRDACGGSDKPSIDDNSNWWLRVLCLREKKNGTLDLDASQVLLLDLGSNEDDVKLWQKCEIPKYLGGWERNVAGRPGPRRTDLASTLDPQRLAVDAAQLNLRLMSWRLFPELDLPLLNRTSCLLLGAGTLGCAVARTLVGWGIRRITFVDQGVVSYSNPVRQSLFTYQDSVDGLGKAEAAAKRLSEIAPNLQVRGVQMGIPMPGHAVPASMRAQVAMEIETLEELVADHDAVFLLTDTRESRWLPSLLCASAQKPLINCALGFESYLVMRHGLDREAHVESDRLGCYFCNDVVAPLDSTANRTLDQQCTVTRPGVAPIAAALAVEILVSMVHHPRFKSIFDKGLGSGKMLERQNSRSLDRQDSNGPLHLESPLGPIPHQVRGFLGSWEQISVSGVRFPRCTACSSAVCCEYAARGHEFLFEVFDAPNVLEKLTGLDEMHRATEETAIDWDDAEGEDF